MAERKAVGHRRVARDDTPPVFEPDEHDLDVGCVDHLRTTRGLPTGQVLHHPDEDTRVAPFLPAIVEGLVRPVGRRSIPLIARRSSTRGFPWLLGK